MSMLVWILAALGLTGGGIGVAALLGGGPAMLMAAKWLLGWLKHATFLQVACIALAIALAVDHGALLVSHHQAASWKKQFNAEHDARKADQDAYRKAQADAHAQNIAHVQQIEQHYQRNSDNERQAYLSDLAKLRASRVRPQPPAAQGSTGPASPPEADAGAPRINDAGVCVPATSDVCEAGAEIELRLMHLQNLFEQQSQVDPNK
jgi:hypothetical protein